MFFTNTKELTDSITWMNLIDVMLSKKKIKQTQRVHTLWFYLFRVQGKAKLLFSNRNRNNSSLWGLGIPWKGTFWVGGKVLLFWMRCWLCVYRFVKTHGIVNLVSVHFTVQIIQFTLQIVPPNDWYKMIITGIKGPNVWASPVAQQ